MNNQDLINEIRNKVDIVDIIGERVPLVAKGKNFFGVCPFHEDTNPSMSVSREKQIYRCFSCGASGNVFTFLMDYEQKEFKEVLKELGERVGINTSKIKVSKENTKFNSLYEAYDLAQKYYQNNLKSQLGRGARDYLKNRGLDEQVIKDFGVGLSLSNKKDLTTLLTKKNYDLKTLNEIGLSIDDRDTYTERIMFPLHDTYGHIVGFSGRIYQEGQTQNKYINTKETAIFKKGNCLYHYHIAKDTCRVKKSVIIMEGFMDVVRAATIGITNTIALMGTALTKEQTTLIKRLSKNIILCLDGDSPGRMATLKIGEQLLKHQIEVKVITLPEDDDPDTYILNKGKEKFEELIEKAENFGDYKINMLKENVNFQSDEELSNYIHQVLLETAKIEDDIRTEIILKRLAKDYNIGYNTLEKRFNALKEQKVEKKIEIKPKKKIRRNKYILAMEQLIYYMLNHDWVVDAVEKERLIFPSNETRLLTSEVIYYYKKQGTIEIADFYTYMQDKEELSNLLNQIISSNYREEITKTELFDYFKVIREYSMNEQIKRLEKRIKDEPDDMEKAKISEQIRKLKLGE